MSQAQVSRKRKPEIEINPPNPEKKRKFSKPQSSKTEFKPRDDNIELDFPETDHKSMILISQLNKLGSKLLKKKDEDEINKTIIIDKILTKIGSLLHKLIHKKSASKFVQACYKYGNEKQRTLIFKLLNQGDLSEVFKSKYGHFVLLKVLKKCDKDQKNKIFEEICKNIYIYCSHSVILKNKY